MMTIAVSCMILGWLTDLVVECLGVKDWRMTKDTLSWWFSGSFAWVKGIKIQVFVFVSRCLLLRFPTENQYPPEVSIFVLEKRCLGKPSKGWLGPFLLESSSFGGSNPF